MKKMDKIREAVTRNRGGLEGASDGQIQMIWESLDEQTRQAYLQSVKAKEGKGKDAVST